MNNHKKKIVKLAKKKQPWCVNNWMKILILIFSVNKFDNFFLNIELFHNIFFYMAWKKHMINLNNLIVI